MCDTITKKDLPDSEKPQYVYKRVQKVGEGKYISPVMGELLQLDVWKKAPSRVKIKDTLGTSSDCLVRKLRRPYRQKAYSYSSEFIDYHDGMFAAFKHETGAFNADMISNFIKPKGKAKKPVVALYPTIVVKCEVKGTVHAAQFTNRDTYLSEYIKIVEEGRFIR